MNRQQALNQLRIMRDWHEDNGNGPNADYDAICYAIGVIEAQPDNKLQELAEEIASFKKCVKSNNSDYLTGYLCALSAVEGMIAERRTDG